MNWDAVGAIAEGLGAIGVILTVVYVALQIRQNSEAVKGSTEQELMSQEMALYSMLARHANVYRRGCASMDDLDVDERVEFEHLVTAVMSQLYSAFVQYQRKLIPESVWAAYCVDWPINIGQPGFKQAWTKIKASYPSEYRLALDQVSEENLQADGNSPDC